jgi:hypothetical protein
MSSAPTAWRMLLVTSLASTGCSALAPEAAPGPDADFAGRQAMVYCARTFECCGERVAGQSQSQCETVSKFSLVTDANELRDAIERGTASYDAAAAERCLDTLASESCEVWTSFVERRGPEVCSGLVTGHLAEGQACQSHFECAGGSCMVEDGGARKCQPLAKLGEACVEPAIRYCEPPLACRQDSDGVAVCAELRSEGESCARDGDCHAGLCVEGRCDLACNRRT